METSSIGGTRHQPWLPFIYQSELESSFRRCARRSSENRLDLLALLDQAEETADALKPAEAVTVNKDDDEEEVGLVLDNDEEPEEVLDIVLASQTSTFVRQQENLHRRLSNSGPSLK